MPRFVILYYRESSEGFSQTNRVRQDAAVIRLKLVDDSQSGIALEIVQYAPNLRIPETGYFFWEKVFVDVVKEFFKYVLKNGVVEQLGRVLLIERCDRFDYLLGNVFRALFVFPRIVKQPKQL